MENFLREEAILLLILRGYEAAATAVIKPAATCLT